MTGSSSGIGNAIARRLLKDGYACILHGGTNQAKLESTMRQLSGQAQPITALLANFEQTAQWKAFAEEAWDWKQRIDVLVNCAGADLLTRDVELPLDRKLHKLVRVDVEATMMLSLSIGERMRQLARVEGAESGTFSICNLGWDQAFQGMAGESGVLFSASKGSIMSMTLSLAQSLAPEVRVNCVAPGWIRTSWGETASDEWQKKAISDSLMNRWGTPDDVANAVSFLCGTEANFISGQVLNVNGGFRHV